MRRIIVWILTLFVLCSAFPVSVFAGGRVFVGIRGRHHFFPRVGVFSHHRRSRSHFFFQFGHTWGRHPRENFYPPVYLPPVVAPYSATPQGTPQASYSGTDQSSALYVEGYRVLPSGWLRIHVEPTDAEVLVDGFPVSIDRASGTSSSLGFPVGPHQLEVRKSGFQAYQSEVEIKQAREVLLRIWLSE